MFNTTLKTLLARKGRLFTTALAIVLGVAFMAGTLVLTDTINKTFDSLYASIYKNTSAVVRAKSVFKGPQLTGDQRARVDESLVATLQRVDGVAVAQGDVTGYARIVGKDGNALGNPTMAPTMGTSWGANSKLNWMNLAGGRAPAAADEVAIDKKSATDGGYVLGDTATVLVQGPPLRVRIVGLLKFGTADSPLGASVVAFEPAVTQRLVGEPGKFDSISLIAKPGVSQSELVARVSSVLPGGVEAVTGAKITQESQSSVKQGLSFIRTFLLVFALVALLVGAFMIFNTFSITVAQRTRENALLRALGASRRQVLTSVLAEAVVVGLIASVAGLVLGIAVAIGLKGLLAAVGFPIPAGGAVLATRTVIVAVLAGTLLAVVAAVSPARKAAKVPPVAAMHEVPVGSTGYGSKERIFVGLLLLGLGVAVLFAGLLSDVGNKLAVVGLGVLLVFLAVSVLGRTVSLPMSRVIGAFLPRLRGVTGGLARENAMRNPKRTAASASALMIGVGLVAFISIFAASTKASTNATIDRVFTGDYVVNSGGGLLGGIDPALAARLNQTPGVASATGVRVGSALVMGQVQMLTAADPKTAFGIFDVKPQAGSTADLGPDTIAMYKDVARDHNLHVGDMVPVVFKDTGARQMRLALIYGENQPAGNYFLGLSGYEANFATQYDYQVYVKKAPGADPAQTFAAVKAAAKIYPGASVWNQADFKAAQASQVNQLLALIYALLALAIIIALLGIGNTLALSIFERTRELGLLRAVGMTRSQLRSTIRWESVIIALQGAVLGLAIGVFFGWALVNAMNNKGVGVFSLPVAQLVVVVLLAAVAGVVAAILPSRRAAKLNVLRAIVTE